MKTLTSGLPTNPRIAAMTIASRDAVSQDQ
jgi:hypothetical protein